MQTPTRPHRGFNPADPHLVNRPIRGRAAPAADRLPDRRDRRPAHHPNQANRAIPKPSFADVKPAVGLPSPPGANSSEKTRGVTNNMSTAGAHRVKVGHRPVVRIVTSLLEASAVAALVFALAWIRPPLALSTLVSTVRLFIVFGCVFAILSLLIGLPFVLIIQRCRIGAGWSYTIVAAATGALLAFGFGHRPTGEVGNPHGGAVFSPWTRDSPGIDDFPVSSNEYLGSIAFLAIVGGALGFAFWYFYSRGPRLNNC
jgi:hypothetical protein